MINKKIFREYDIRGEWEKDLTPKFAELLGKAFGTRLIEVTGKQHPLITVGRDVRLSSRPISENLEKGLISTGALVLSLGDCPTPAQYFSLYHHEADGGVMITGSHNPPEYNGFKMSIGKETIYGEDIRKLWQIMEESVYAEGRGESRLSPVLMDYERMLREKFSDLSGIKLVIDAGNGTAGLIAPLVMKSLGVEVIELFCEPDGQFPNHHPDPVLPENLVHLRKAVNEAGAHLGVAYDGDSDRLGVVDEKGEIIWGDSLMIIFSRDILAEHSGATIIGDVKCSQVMYDDIGKHGGTSVMWKTGHSLIKKKMKEEKALLAGEMSGHIFFADRYFGYDDAIYATLRLLEILKKRGAPYSLGSFLKGLPKVVSTPEIRFDCDDDLKFRVIERMRDAFSGYKINTLDGVRIDFDDGWALVRASNTQPALVMRFESQTEMGLKRIREVVEEKLRSALAGAS